MICCCLQCGQPLPKGRRKYCSDSCAHIYYVQVLAPLWWDNARKMALERDGHRCRKCGHQGRLPVHHIEPLDPGETRWNSPKNRQDNLISLCRPCHEKEHHGLDRIEEARARGQLVMEAILAQPPS